MDARSPEEIAFGNDLVKYVDPDDEPLGRFVELESCRFLFDQKVILARGLFHDTYCVKNFNVFNLRIIESEADLLISILGENVLKIVAFQMLDI
jgi:hypothetical protein